MNTLSKILVAVSTCVLCFGIARIVCRREKTSRNKDQSFTSSVLISDNEDIDASYDTELSCKPTNLVEQPKNKSQTKVLTDFNTKSSVISSPVTQNHAWNPPESLSAVASVDLGTTRSFMMDISSNGTFNYIFGMLDRYTRSLISFSEDGRVCYESSSPNFYYGLKRLMGQVYGSDEGKMLAESLNGQEFVQDPATNQYAIKIKWKGKDEFLSPEVFSALILHHILERREAGSNMEELTHLVMTVPENASNAQLLGMLQVAKMNGIDNVRFISESDANGFSYYFRIGTSLGKNKIFAGIDIGGGTTDISVFETTDDGFKKIAQNGYHIGGESLARDFGKRIYELIRTRIIEKKLAPKESIPSYDELPIDCIKKLNEATTRHMGNFTEKTSILFSDTDILRIFAGSVNSIRDASENSNFGQIIITKRLFEDTLDNLISDIVEKLSETMESVSKDIENIDAIQCFGGTSAINGLKDSIVKQVQNHNPNLCEVQAGSLKESVAEGALIAVACPEYQNLSDPLWISVNTKDTPVGWDEKCEHDQQLFKNIVEHNKQLNDLDNLLNELESKFNAIVRNRKANIKKFGLDVADSNDEIRNRLIDLRKEAVKAKYKWEKFLQNFNTEDHSFENLFTSIDEKLKKLNQ